MAGASEKITAYVKHFVFGTNPFPRLLIVFIYGIYILPFVAIDWLSTAAQTPSAPRQAERKATTPQNGIHGKRLSTILRQIRTIILFPSPDPNAQIQCTFMRRRIGIGNWPLLYSALSYAWGGGSKPQTILVDGVPVAVTANLFAALKQFRRPTETLELWIDALCINQDDVQERNHQVRLMGHIYKRASAVLMWLGEAEDDSHLAADFVDSLSRIMTPGAKPEWIKSVADLFAGEGGSSRRQALERLVTRQYWGRVWIIQEVLLSWNSYVCYGSFRQPWRHWVTAFGPLGSLTLTTITGGLGFKPTPALAREINLIYSLVMAYRERYGPEKRMSLIEGLMLFRNRKATDPRDHVYAILNLVDGKNSGIQVDYNLSIFSLYRSIVVQTVVRSRNLDILSACKRLVNTDSRPLYRTTSNKHMQITHLLARTKGLPKADATRSKGPDGEKARSSEVTSGKSGQEETGGLTARVMGSKVEEVRTESAVAPWGKFDQVEEDEGAQIETWTLAAVGPLLIEAGARESVLPSWIPDWRLSPGITNSAQINTIGSCAFKASRDFPPLVEFLENEALMVVCGVRVGVVSAVTPATAGESRIGGYWAMWRDGTHPKHIYGNLRKQREAFVRTVFMDMDTDGSQRTLSVSVEAMHKRFKLDGAVEDGRDTAEDGCLEQGSSQPEADEKDGEVNLGHITALALRGNFFTFCATGNGFMGCVPIGTHVGDVVVVFLGAKVPFILRKYKDYDQYYLVGECYIHGVMDGEMVEDLEETKNGLEKFCLV